MSNKRSRRKKVQHFFCPFCEIRLWRLGSSKHYLFYKDAKEIRQQFKISAKKAALLSNQNSTCLDSNTWIEEFFCTTHGKLWLHISRKENRELVYRLSKREDWLKTSKTFNPNNPNPSISEFSYRMSRRSYYNCR